MPSNPQDTSAQAPSAGYTITTTGNTWPNYSDFVFSPAYPSAYIPNPPRAEQALDNLNRQQVLQFVDYLLDSRKMVIGVASLLGLGEAPTPSDLLIIKSLLSSEREKPLNTDAAKNALIGLKSLSNLFLALSKETASIVKEGQAALVGEITK